MRTDARLDADRTSVDRGTTVESIQERLRALEQLAQGLDVPEPPIDDESASVSDLSRRQLVGRTFDNSEKSHNTPSVVPAHFGEFIPRMQLLPEEVEGKSEFNRNAETVEQSRSLRSALGLYFAWGICAGAIFSIAIQFSDDVRIPKIWIDHYVALGGPLPTSAALAGSSVISGQSIQFRSEEGSNRYPALAVPRAILDDGDLTYVWLRDLPKDAIVSQGLRFNTGVWVLYKSQLRKLSVTLAGPITMPTTVSVDFVKADGSLIAQLSHRLDPVGVNTFDVGLVGGNKH